LGTGKEGEKGNKRASGKTKRKEKEVKGKRMGGKEKGTKGREGEEGKGKWKGRNFVQL